MLAAPELFAERDQASVAIYTTDAAGKIACHNQAATNLAGRSAR
jgi:hypothetical protein